MKKKKGIAWSQRLFSHNDDLDSSNYLLKWQIVIFLQKNMEQKPRTRTSAEQWKRDREQAAIFPLVKLINIICFDVCNDGEWCATEKKNKRKKAERITKKQQTNARESGRNAKKGISDVTSKSLFIPRNNTWYGFLCSQRHMCMWKPFNGFCFFLSAAHSIWLQQPKSKTQNNKSKTKEQLH